MNRKTASILCAAGGLAAAAAILGTRPHPAGGSRDPEPPHPPEIVKRLTTGVCGLDTAPAHATADFGAGTMTAALSGEQVLFNGDGEMYMSIDLEARET